jgi:hypothetical protein
MIYEDTKKGSISYPEELFEDKNFHTKVKKAMYYLLTHEFFEGAEFEQSNPNSGSIVLDMYCQAVIKRDKFIELVPEMEKCGVIVDCFRYNPGYGFIFDVTLKEGEMTTE